MKHQIRADFDKLENLIREIYEETKLIDAHFNQGEIIDLLKKEPSYDKHRSSLLSLDYLKQLSDDTLWSSYTAACLDNTFTAPFKDFEQEHRDIFSRLKNRAQETRIKEMREEIKREAAENVEAVTKAVMAAMDEKMNKAAARVEEKILELEQRMDRMKTEVSKVFRPKLRT